MTRLRYTASLVSQGKYRFYTLTVPSDVLARTCFVVSREENPKEGFQRLLDKKRAEQIAEYIDSGMGTIPNSIVLSAQPNANFTYSRKSKTVEFEDNSHAFLILDGQHRVYGFSLATSELRVPVVIYSELSRQDETRLFIDINTKQRPVPNELLLDIRKLAEYQNDAETRIGEIFDLFHNTSTSPLLGLLSPSSRKKDSISRVTFNTAIKPLLDLFEEFNSKQVYDILSAYFSAIISGINSSGLPINISSPIPFRGIVMLFEDVARIVKDRHGPKYTIDNFDEALSILFANLKASQIRQPGNSVIAYYTILSNALRSRFSLS